MGKDAYYFSHDSNARTDTKIADMIFDYGMEGYGMYWVIVEVLRENENFKLKHNKSTCRALAMQMHITCIEKITKFVDDCINDYELFATDGEFFWSESLIRRMGKVEDIREKRRKAAQKRWNKEENNANAYEDDANALQMDSISNANAMQDYAKEKKRKEKKEKESNIYIDLSFIDECIDKVKITEEQYKRLVERFNKELVHSQILALDNYVTNNKNGSKYKDHYKALINWCKDKAVNTKVNIDKPLINPASRVYLT